jgi:hypothetical protein
VDKGDQPHLCVAIQAVAKFPVSLAPNQNSPSSRTRGDLLTLPFQSPKYRYQYQGRVFWWARNCWALLAHGGALRVVQPEIFCGRCRDGLVLAVKPPHPVSMLHRLHDSKTPYLIIRVHVCPTAVTVVSSAIFVLESMSDTKMVEPSDKWTAEC